MVNKDIDNLVMAGRMICVERNAYGATRVMVNCNQTGEAAGVAAYLAMKDNIPVYNLDHQKLRNVMKDGGSLIL
jgi:hypothetical protein